jgi:hypothetical protein
MNSGSPALLTIPRCLQANSGKMLSYKSQMHSSTFYLTHNQSHIRLYIGLIHKTGNAVIETHKTIFKTPRFNFLLALDIYKYNFHRRNRNISHTSTTFFNWDSGGGGGVGANWVHTAMRPPKALLCQPRVIMMMEKLVE